MARNAKTVIASRSTKSGIYDLGDGPVGVLPLSDLLFSVVDADRYEEFSRYAWSTNRQGYVYRRDSRSGKQLFLHRVVNETPDGWITDHINGDKQDNRRANLRTVTHAQNSQAFQAPRKSYAPRGVFFNPKTGKWKAQIYRFGKCVYGGVYATKEEAIAATARLMNADDDDLDRASAAAEDLPKPEAE